MPRADQKRDKLGRFADEGKGDETDAALVARSRKRILRLRARIEVARVKFGELVEFLEKEIFLETQKLNSLL